MDLVTAKVLKGWDITVVPNKKESFRWLKTKNQAREYERLQFLTLLYSVIAMQILNLTYLGKICPEISGEVVLDEEEWKILYCCARKTKEIPQT